MARQKMVTRTVVTTTAEVMALDVTTAEVTIETITLPDTYTDNNALLKKIQKTHDTETKKHVAIQSTSTAEQLYGMTETDFMKYAKILPPRKNYEKD